MKYSKDLFEDEHYEHNINTGYIHTDMCNNWSDYSLKLFEEVEWNLKSILWRNQKITVPYDERLDRYLEAKRKMYDSYMEYRKDPGNPPFMEYFMQLQEDGLALISYSENCLLHYGEDMEFDLFFALKVKLTDLMDLRNFLTYQLSANFKDNIGNYKNFLTALSLKYKSLFDGTSIPEALKIYIGEELIDNPDLRQKAVQPLMSEAPADNKVNKQADATSRQHVIAMHLLMEALGESNYDRTALARFVQFFSGRETGAKSITNTGIYAYSKAPFQVSKPELLKALETIRPYFKDLGLSRSLAELDRRLESASISKKR